MPETTSLAPMWGRAALPLPDVGQLSESQQRGAACVWCKAPMTAVTAVDLGERRIRVLDTHFTAFPRGCRPCTAKAARRALWNHGALCEECMDADRGLCETDMALRRLIREAMTKPWSPADLAFQRWCGHVIKCRVCRSDETRCERGKRLHGIWREARKGAGR